MVTVTITFFIIFSFISQDIFNSESTRNDVQTYLLYLNSEGERISLNYTSGTTTLIEVDTRLTIDLGVLSYVERVRLTARMNADRGQIILESHYHRLVKGPKNTHMPRSIELNIFEYYINKMCRVMRLLGNFTLNELFVFGNATIHDYNLGCVENEEISVGEMRSISSLEDCITACINSRFYTAFFKQIDNAPGECHCSISNDQTRVSPRLCNIPCRNTKYQMCGGKTFFSGYSLGRESTNYDNPTMWICLYNTTLCQECFVRNGLFCEMEDHDECSFPDSCGSNARCRNLRSTFDCYCSQGYVPDNPNYNCTDVDECADVTYCQNGICLNTEGSFTCDCYTGFEKKNSICVDIDECATTCKRDNFECTNSPGSYECSCKKGFQEYIDSCNDTDECSSEEKPCGQYECNNTIGSYECLCPDGMKASIDYSIHMCEDENECVDENKCQLLTSLCINIRDGYICHCLEGFKNIDDWNCEAIESKWSEKNEITEEYDYDDDHSSTTISSDLFSHATNIYIMIILAILLALLMYFWLTRKRGIRASLASTDS